MAEDRVIGGENTSEYPAIGALLYKGAPECTGTLIGPRQVLTAAHCLEDEQVSNIQFAIGYTVRRPVAKIKAIAMFMHPDYDTDTLENDIGYLVLAEDAPAEPIRVLEEMDEGWVGEELRFFGYGTNNARSQTGYGVKRVVAMEVTEVSEASFLFGGREANICDGDSGGPAIYEDEDGVPYVVGVTSAGDRRCRRFGQDTRVDAYLDFIGVEPGCEGETFMGRCDGSTLVWCEGGKPTTLDCTSIDAECAMYEDEGFYCLE